MARGGILTIDLEAVNKNYQILSEKVYPSICSAVVKADAYGLGCERVVKSLLEIGCKHFFVGYIEEAYCVQKALQDEERDAKIFILNDSISGKASEFDENNFIPVINRYEDFEAWYKYSKNKQDGIRRSFLLHFDTGMHRLGMRENSIEKFIQVEDWKEYLDLICIMSHLACADESDHPLNKKQKSKFDDLLLKCDSPASLANSSGIFLGADYHYQMVRPGAALYGINPTPDKENPMFNVVKLESKVLKIQRLAAGESIGYGATYVADKDKRIATLSIGYADGFFRALGNKWHVIYKDFQLPVVGRVSMDLIVVDIDQVPAEDIQVNSWMTILGEKNSADEMAKVLDTIGYEILTNIGPKSVRRYI